MLNIAITGGNGFIGSYLIKLLLKKKINLFLLSKNKPSLQNVHFLKFDLTKVKEFNYDKFKEIDVLIHLAWIPCKNYYSSNHLRQIKYHKIFLNKVILNGVKNIIVSGTCFEYGKREGQLKETYSVNSSTKYGLGKLKILNFLKKKQKKKKYNLVWLRIFYIEGYFKKSNSIFNQLIKKIKNRNKFFKMSSGNQVRDYIKINKLVDIIFKISIKQKNFGIINIGSGKKKRLLTYVKKWINLKKSNIKVIRNYYNLPKYEPLKSWACTRKLNAILYK